MTVKMKAQCSLLLFLLLLASPVLRADYSQHPGAAAVVDRLVGEFGFGADEARQILAQAETEQRILDSMANAAEKTKTWQAYRASFVTEQRVQMGVDFLEAQREHLAAAESEYGVPRAVIAAILGVETNYGGYTGRAHVLNALATLAFEHPRRGKFFSSELVEYIVLCKEKGWAIDEPRGSYAGALGMSQFMPSNYRRLAVDGDGDGDVDLFTPADAIHSVANYLRAHGWRPGGTVAVRAAAGEQHDASVAGRGLKPDRTVAQLEQAGFFAQSSLPQDSLARLVHFSDEDSEEFWLGLQNFYAISRYNPRAKYAMAVFHLSEAISAGEPPATAIGAE